MTEKQAMALAATRLANGTDDKNAIIPDPNNPHGKTFVVEYTPAGETRDATPRIRR